MDGRFVAGRDQGWEWACSRRGRHIQHCCWLTRRFREQARSHRGLWWMKDWGGLPRSRVGVGLLTKGPAHSALLLTDLTLSRASPLPQGTVVDEGLGGLPRSRVGVGLLTKGPAHSALLLADPTLSRASPLPQGTVVDEGLGGLAAIKGGSGCSRRGRHIQHCCWLTRRFREQARSHRGLWWMKDWGAGRDQGWEWACSRRGRHIQHCC